MFYGANARIVLQKQNSLVNTDVLYFLAYTQPTKNRLFSKLAKLLEIKHKSIIYLIRENFYG